MGANDPPRAAVPAVPFGGYYQRPVEAGEDPLARVGPGTPCGDYLRRYWHPFMLASELGEEPKATRLLGEDLVVFRDRSGRLGLLGRHCVHRGTSLEFGIPAERGIRCCYHGWHFDIDGTILDTPAEPADSRIKERIKQRAYAIREQHGLFFAYLGPSATMPPLPQYDCYSHPTDTVFAPFKMNLPCNWVQVVENAADPIHNAFLHAIVSGEQFSAAFKVLPVLDFPETPLGFLSMATRKVGNRVFVRASDMMLPNISQFTPGTNRIEHDSFSLRPGATRWSVPVDDEHSLYIGIGHIHASIGIRSMDPSDFGVDKMPFIGQTPDRPYVERQREPGDYDALVTQGAIANRRAEHLGVTDRGIVTFRRQLARAIAAVQAGEAPPIPATSSGPVVPTYTHEVVATLPKPEVFDDREALERLGRSIAAVYVELGPLPKPERETRAAERVRSLIEAQSNGG